MQHPARHLGSQRSKGSSTRKNGPQLSNHKPNIPGDDSAEAAGHQGRGSTDRKPVSIREQLRAWSAANPEPPPAATLQRTGTASLANVAAKTFSHAEAGSDLGAIVADGGSLTALAVDSADLEAVAGTFECGDLVELANDWSTRRPMLAVCLGLMPDGHDYWYAQNGKWFALRGAPPRTIFAVRGFMTRDELRPIIDALPVVAKGAAAEPGYHEFEDGGGRGGGDGHDARGPTRHVGQNALRQLMRFVNGAETFYHRHALRLDKAPELVRRGLGAEHATLGQIADFLLPKHMAKAEGLERAVKLFAVHTALKRDDIAFRPWHVIAQTMEPIYHITSAKDMRRVERLEEMIREVMNHRSGIASRLGRHYTEILSSFVEKARRAIHTSRQSREWSAHGVLGPSSGPSKQRGSPWNEREISILRFMETWAATGRFTSVSRMHGIGAAILRELNVYPESAILDGSVGWTFLQEVGWIPSWETPSRYKFQLPGVTIDKNGGWSRHLEGEPEQYLSEDVFAGNRKDWGRQTIYCIDSLSTEEVDDGISIEPSSEPGKYWIHVHVADPASQIAPDSALANYAEQLCETIYLDGHQEKMLPDSIAERFSLAPGRSCLTFSSLVDENGAVSDIAIRPGTVANVVYMTYEELDIVCGTADGQTDTAKSRDIVFSVGTPAQKPVQATRPMTSASMLSPADKAELQLLNQLMIARRKHYAAMGTPFSLPRGVTVSTSFPSGEGENGSRSRAAGPCGDPHIRVTASGSAVAATTPTSTSSQGPGYFTSATVAAPSATTSNATSVTTSATSQNTSNRASDVLVATAMVLAGEAAASWAVRRDLHLPFRSQPTAVANEAAIRRLLGGRTATEMLSPRTDGSGAETLERGIQDDDAAAAEAALFWRLKGPDILDDRPGKGLLTMGVRAYCKVTSPLRRYADLLAHWQIERVLAREMGLPLPSPAAAASRHGLREKLRWIQARERVARSDLIRADREDRLLQALVRAWRFGDMTSPLLSTTPAVMGSRETSSNETSNNEMSGSSDGTTAYKPQTSSAAAFPSSFRFVVEGVHPSHALARGRLADFFGVRAEMVFGDEMDFWDDDNGDGDRLQPLRAADVRPGDCFEVRLRDVNVYWRLVSVRPVRRMRKGETLKGSIYEMAMAAADRGKESLENGAATGSPGV